MGIVKSLFSSKKFISMLIGIAVLIGAEVGLDLDPEALAAVVSTIVAYILSQGVADIGKEKAKVENGKGEEK